MFPPNHSLHRTPPPQRETQHYHNRLYLVFGRVGDVVVAKDGSGYVRLAALLSEPQVTAWLTPESFKRISYLNKGDEITLSGRFNEVAELEIELYEAEILE